MNRLHRVFLFALLCAPLWATSPAYQDKAKIQSFKNDIAEETKKLTAGEKDFLPKCGPCREDLLKVINNWKTGFDPDFITPARNAVEGEFKAAQAKLKDAISKTKTAAVYESRAKSESIYKVSEVVTVLRGYEQARKRLETWTQIGIKEAKIAQWDLKSPWAVLVDRVDRMAKDVRAGVSPPKESCPVITVGKEGLVLCRVWGGDAGEWGPWWSPGQPPNTAKEGRLWNAAPPKNYCDKVTIIELHPGARIAVGDSTPNFGHPDPKRKQDVFTDKLKTHYGGAWFNVAKIPANENPLGTGVVSYIRHVAANGRALSD